MEYDLAKSKGNNVVVASWDRIEQSAVPCCMAWHSAFTKETFLLTANDQVVHCCTVTSRTFPRHFHLLLLLFFFFFTIFFLFFFFVFCGRSAVSRPSVHLLPEIWWCGAGLTPFPTACWWLTHPTAITAVSVAARWNSPGGCGGPSVPLLCNRPLSLLIFFFFFFFFFFFSFFFFFFFCYDDDAEY